MRFARGLAAVLAAALAPAALLADTPAFVRMLERSHARATFFLIGAHVGASFRPTLLRELRDGIGIPRPELPRDALLQRAP